MTAGMMITDLITLQILVETEEELRNLKISKLVFGVTLREDHQFIILVKMKSM
jgi:hypothetical protein